MKFILSTAIGVIIGCAITMPFMKYEAKRAMEYAMRCEQMLIAGNLEPMCAGYLQSIGHDVETKAIIYSNEPYNQKRAKEKTLAQLREIGVKP